VRDRRKETGLLMFAQNPGAALLFKQTTTQVFGGEEVESPNLMQQQNIIDRQVEDKSDNKKDIVIIRYFPRTTAYNP
jgi:hypothetical protein